MKYLVRAGRKDNEGDIADLRKAQEFITRSILQRELRKVESLRDPSEGLQAPPTYGDPLEDTPEGVLVELFPDPTPQAQQDVEQPSSRLREAKERFYQKGEEEEETNPAAEAAKALEDDVLGDGVDTYLLSKAAKLADRIRARKATTPPPTLAPAAPLAEPLWMKHLGAQRSPPGSTPTTVADLAKAGIATAALVEQLPKGKPWYYVVCPDGSLRSLERAHCAHLLADPRGHILVCS